MRTLHVVLDTGVGQNLVRSDLLPIGWRQNLVTLAHLPMLCYGNGTPLQLLGVVLLRLRLGNYHSRAPFIVAKNLVASMIICTEFLDSDVRVIRCMEGIDETTRGTVHILGRDKAIVYSAEAKVERPQKRGESPPIPDKTSLLPSASRAVHGSRYPNDRGSGHVPLLATRPRSHVTEACGLRQPSPSALKRYPLD